jgi:hypothetical protein
MERRERSYRGISARAAIGYLENLGGERVDADESATGDPEADTAVEGDGWTADVTAEKVEVGPSLKLTEVTVRFEGDVDVLDPLIEKFSQKAIRAGG